MPVTEGLAWIMLACVGPVHGAPQPWPVAGLAETADVLDRNPPAAFLVDLLAADLSTADRHHSLPEAA